MTVDITHLPNDVGILKEIIHSQVATYTEIKSDNSTLKRSLTELRSQYTLLEEQFRLLKNTLYGRKSEKYVAEKSTSRVSLFNEPEEVAETSATEEKTEEVTVTAYKRAKGGRRPLPPSHIDLGTLYVILWIDFPCTGFLLLATFYLLNN